MTRHKKNLVALFASLPLLFALMHRQAVAAGAVLSHEEILSLAQKTVQEHNFNADPKMLAAMAVIESSGNPTASRYEAHINDISVGLMQTLGETARWLASDMGYRAHGVPSNADLADPEVSMYFGAAYVDYLSNFRGVSRKPEWIVRAYNGGPYWKNNPVSVEMTQNHWNKYKAARMKF